MQENNSQISIFQRPAWVMMFALTAAVVWGFAFPLVKMGFAEYQITTDMTGGKMLFAGLRFFFAGLIILAVAKVKGRSFKVNKRADWWYIICFSLLNTTLHYAFFYFGLSHITGSRGAILNSMSVFVLVIMACVFFESDKLTVRKIVGCVMGFTGIVSLNLGGAESGHFTWLGDGMLILNALCSASAALMTRGLSRKVDVFVGTGYGLSIGGGTLVLAGLAAGGTLPQVTPQGIAILIGLIGISTLGFTLYNKLLSCNPMGKVAIFNSLIPVVGAVSSCVILGEIFYWKYVIAGALAAGGIYVINRGK